LNFNSYFSFGEELNHRITIGVSNILDQSRQMVYQSFQATDEIFNIFKPGRAFSIKYSFTF
jgi:hypothetical protein